MARKTFDADETATGKPAVDPSQYRTCWRCQGSAPAKPMSDTGGMCFPCFAAYRREGCSKTVQKLPQKPRQRNFLAQGEEGEAA